MKKLMIAAVLAGALAGVAADNSYSWTAGDTSLGDGAVVLTYEEGTTDVKTLTATPTDGGTVSITGDAMTFADDAAITLATSGTVAFASKVTTKGALTLARGDDAYIVWTGSSAMTESAPGALVATGMTRDDVDFVALIPAASSAAVRSPYTFISGPNSAGFYVFNRVTASYVYSARVQLTEKDGNLYVRCRTCLRSPRFGLYPDEEDSWAAEDLWNKWTRKDEPSERAYYGLEEDAPSLQNGEWLGNPSKLGLNKIILRRKGKTGKAKVRFGGGASFGGTTTIDAGVEAVLTGLSRGVDSATKITLNKSIAGDGDFTVEAPASLPDTATVSGYITTNWQVIARNCLLADVKKVEGYMQGSSHNPLPGGFPSWCKGYFYNYDPSTDTATCQFQCANSTKTYKYVSAQFKQEGSDILIKGVGYGYVSSNGKPGDQLRTPTTYNVSYWNPSTYSYSRSGYGMSAVTIFFNETEDWAPFGKVFIDYDHAGGDLSGLVGGKFSIKGSDLPMYVVVGSKTGFPYSGEVHVDNNAELWLNVTNANNSTFISSSTSKLVIHEGGIVHTTPSYSWQLGGGQEFVLAGGTYMPHAYAHHISYLTLSNAVVAGKSPRVEVNSRTGNNWRVIGDRPSTVSADYGAHIYGVASAANARSNNRAFHVEVADVTRTPEADCTFSKIRAAVDRNSDRESFTWFWFEKYGRGTLKILGDAKDVRMESKIFGGTLLLAGNNIMTNAVELSGGSLAVDVGVSNSLGNLTANTNGTLTVGEGGSLSFASFTASEELQPNAITIEAPLTGNVLRFGNDDTALSSAQRAYFRWRDPTEETVFYRVKIDEQGYVHPRKSGTAVVVK